MGKNGRFRFALAAGYSYGAEMDSLKKDKEIKFTEVNKDIQGLKMVLLGRADAFPIEVNVYKSLVKKAIEDKELTEDEVSKLVLHEKIIYETPLFLIFNKDQEKLRDEFNKALEDL